MYSKKILKDTLMLKSRWKGETLSENGGREVSNHQCLFWESNTRGLKTLERNTNTAI